MYLLDIASPATGSFCGGRLGEALALENHGLAVSAPIFENSEFDFRLIGQHFEILGRVAFRVELTGYASQHQASNG